MRAASTWLISIEDRRRRSRPVELADLPDEPRQRVAGVPVAIAAQVDAGQDDLAVALRDPPAHLVEHRGSSAAARAAAHERDHAEVAGEAAAVLDLHERTHAIEACVGLHAADRAHVARHEGRRLLASPPHDGDVLRKPGERVAREVRRAAGDVHLAVSPRRACSGLSRLADGLVCNAARVDDGDIGADVVGALYMTVARGAARARPAHRYATPCNRENERRTSSSALMLLRRKRRFTFFRSDPPPSPLG